ncbi:MAG: dihydrolipoyl dehydrogenase [Thermoanaerobaculia bacterium]
MTQTIEIRIPDIGDAEDVQVVEILVAPGDQVAAEDGLITLESEKASMDVPSTTAGKVLEIHLEVGAKVEEGDLILTLEATESNVAESTVPSLDETKRPATVPAEPTETPQPTSPEPSPPQAPKPPGPQAHSSDLHAEVLVLGAGPGGYTAAFRAADLGQKVVLVERHARLGGVCLNVGCIPSKALLHVGRVMEEAADLEKQGVAYGPPKIDLGKIRGFKDGVVDRLTKGLVGLAKQRQVEVVAGTGRFTSDRTLAVETADGDKTISFDHAIIAAGSRVIRIPGIPWDDPRVMDSTGALELQDIPKRLLLIGGGNIGLEMAMVYGALGSELTIVEMLDGLIPGCDRDLVKPLERRLKRRYKAKIYLETKVAKIEPQKRALEVYFEGDKAPEPAHFDRVLVSVGRRPNGDLIAADQAGVEVDDRGFIRVDNRQRTNVPHILAIGDVTGHPMLAHRATHQGKVAAEVAAGLKSAFDARVIPSVTYTDPEIAWVGLTETEATAKGVAYGKGAFPWSASGRSLGMGRSDGLTKILFDPGSNRVLGAGIVGPNAGDLIAELALAIEMDTEAADLALTIHPHPTLSETVALAAEAYEGTITDLYLPKNK